MTLDSLYLTLFTRKSIKDFRHREYPQYVWERILEKWDLGNRTGFELESAKYRPNVFTLKDEYSMEIVNYTMIGVYTEYISTLTSTQRKSLKKAGYRHLAHHIDNNSNIPRVLNISDFTLKDLEKLLRK